MKSSGEGRERGLASRQMTIGSLVILRFHRPLSSGCLLSRIRQDTVKMRAPLSVFGVLQRSLPRFHAAEAFACRKSVHNQAQTAYKSVRQTPFLSAFRSRAAPARHQSTVEAAPSPLSDLSQSLGQQTASKKKSSFPETSDKKVAYWLLGSAASVFGIVIFGGLTRLTESGFVLLETSCLPCVPLTQMM